MKRFLNRFTPQFILQLEHRMLLNSPLAWQFQLPRILWYWFCLTTVGAIVPLLMSTEITRSNKNMESLALYVVVLGILQFFLYGYILIQFNASKNFVTRRWWHGIVEQLVYVLVMMLCLSQFLVYSLILENRRASYMSEEEIKNEIATFNKARHYFMGNREDYMYFPDEKTFLKYMSLEGSEADSYYYNDVAPLMREYFTKDSEMYYIDKQHTRLKPGPRLYYIKDKYNVYLKNEFKASDNKIFRLHGSFQFSENYMPHTFQLHKKGRAERLKEIKEFKALIAKYVGVERYSNNDDLSFESDEQILEKYYSNQFQLNYSRNGYAEGGDIHTYELETIHENIMRAKETQWIYILEVLMITFFIAFPFSLLLFIYKNTQLRPILVAVISVILLGILTGILSLLFGLREHLLVHMPFFVFTAAVIVMITQARTYNLWYTVLVIVANVCFCAVPFYIFIYLQEYHTLFSYPSYSENPEYYNQMREWKERAMWCCFWGGIIVYVFAGTIWFKRVYARIWALPLAK